MTRPTCTGPVILRHKDDKSNVLVISPAPIPFKLEHKQALLLGGKYKYGPSYLYWPTNICKNNMVI